MILRVARTISALSAVCLVSLASMALACDPSTNESGGTQALFEIPRPGEGGGDFYALPYPNDLRVTSEGRIDLSTHARPNPLAELYLDAVANQQRGYSLNAPVLFRFEAPLDPATLPASPSEAASESASVYLVNLQADSPRYGERLPAKFRFEERAGSVIGPNWLSVVPFPGFPMQESATYGAVVSARVRAASGGALAPSADFAAIREQVAATDDGLAEAARRYQPLWDYLDQDGGDARTDVVTAAVFTTQSATALMGQIREVIHRDVAAPVAREIAIATTTDDFILYQGLYDGPIFQRGTIPYARPEEGGDIEVNEAGEPVVQASVELRFALSVPIGAAPADGWPVVLYAHGTGGSFESFVNNGTATALAREGLAAISIDQTLHGPRNPGGNPEIDYFNFQNPLSARDNTLQGALDDFQLARLVVDFNETIDGVAVSFDSERIFFFGHSQGGLTGLPFVAFEPLVKGAVFSGAGGNLMLSLLNKTLPVDIAGLIKLIIRDDPLDEFNPLLGLIQGFLDRSDSVNFGPLIIAEPPAGRVAIDVFHSLGVTDNFTPVPAIKALATSLRIDPLEPLIEDIEGLEIRGQSARAAPISANLAPITGVVAQYNQAPGRDGHFVLFDVPSARNQSIQFLATLARDGVATVVAPD